MARLWTALTKGASFLLRIKKPWRPIGKQTTNTCAFDVCQQYVLGFVVEQRIVAFRASYLCSVCAQCVETWPG